MQSFLIIKIYHLSTVATSLMDRQCWEKWLHEKYLSVPISCLLKCLCVSFSGKIKKNVNQTQCSKKGNHQTKEFLLLLFPETIVDNTFFFSHKKVEHWFMNDFLIFKTGFTGEPESSWSFSNFFKNSLVKNSGESSGTKKPLLAWPFSFLLS